MATAAVICSEYLRCPVCLDLFQEPVTIPCGHSFCLICITRCWSLQGAPTSCPQCRCHFRSDSPPRLCKNSILAQMVEDFSNPQGCRNGVTIDTNQTPVPTTPVGDTAGKSGSNASMCWNPAELTSPWISCLAQRREVTQGFSDMVRILQASGFRLLQLMEWAESQALGRAERQESEEGLSMVIIPGEEQRQSAQVVPSELADHVKKKDELTWDKLAVAVSEFKMCLQELCGDHMGRMIQQVWSAHTACPSLTPDRSGSPQLPLIPRARAEFLQYSREITLDPDTAHCNLFLMQGERRVLCKLQPQNYPDHSGRFDHYTQVMAREPMGQGRHYWEVHLTGNRVSLGVAYSDIARKGHQSHCLAGRNSQSWCLEFTSARCYAWHDKQKLLVATRQQERLGIFLDWDSGSLSFHEVSDNMPILHCFQTSFIQPVYPIFFVSWNSIITIGERQSTLNCAQNKRFVRQLSANF